MNMPREIIGIFQKETFITGLPGNERLPISFGFPDKDQLFKGLDQD